MSTSWKLQRRTFLRGVGTTLALPLLEAMRPASAFAAEKQIPRRLAFLYVPNGIHMPNWTPKQVGTDFDLPSILQPLEPVRDQLLMISGLALDKAKPNGDGPGDHARSVATFLTGCQAKKTHGKDIRVGVSVDQVAANAIGSATKFPSLELGLERGRMAGNCDSGYSCAYSANISWRTETTPNPKEVNPRAVFDRLFTDQSTREAQAAHARREREKLSILDFALDDAKQLKKRLGQTDRRKVDEYLDSLRAVERRIENGGQPADEDGPAIPRPQGIPGDFAEHARLMGDLMVLALQLDLTRVTTYMLANAGSNRTYRQIDVSEAHHGLSHHGNNAEKQAKISKINRYHVEQLAYVLQKMQSIREGDGTLLDHTTLVYGSGIGDGNRHNHNDLPILVAGRGGGTIDTGRHLRVEKETPLMNLYLSLLNRAGVDCDHVGDSTGPLSGLTV